MSSVESPAVLSARADPRRPAGVVRAPPRAARPTARGEGAGRGPAPPHPPLGQHGADRRRDGPPDGTAGRRGRRARGAPARAPTAALHRARPGGPAEGGADRGGHALRRGRRPLQPVGAAGRLGLRAAQGAGPGRVRRRLRGRARLRARRRAGGHLRHRADRGQRPRGCDGADGAPGTALSPADPDRRGGCLRGMGHRGDGPARVQPGPHRAGRDRDRRGRRRVRHLQQPRARQPDGLEPLAGARGSASGGAAEAPGQRGEKAGGAAAAGGDVVPTGE